MAIKFNSVKCPECGATLEVEKERSTFFCSYCGTKIIATDENRKEYHHYDEAKIRKAEADKLVRLKELEIQEQKIKNKAKKTKTCLILTTVSAVISAVSLATGLYEVAVISMIFLMYSFIAMLS